jgi:5-(aminomethyl)-3-furanmethanol phosphate kinase
MWVVKIGGSLCGDPLLPAWLTLLGQLGGGRIALVCGGGTLADEVRHLQERWDTDDLSAHNMAVLTMVQNAYLLNSLNPALRLVNREADIGPTLRRGGVALWQPLELLRHQPDPATNWRHTSDSIALALARRLNAERLVLVKSCSVDAGLDVDQLVDAAVLDDGFGPLARQAGLPIDVLSRDEGEGLRELLLTGQRRMAGAVQPH